MDKALNGWNGVSPGADPITQAPGWVATSMLISNTDVTGLTWLAKVGTNLRVSHSQSGHTTTKPPKQFTREDFLTSKTPLQQLSSDTNHNMSANVQLQAHVPMGTKIFM